MFIGGVAAVILLYYAYLLSMGRAHALQAASMNTPLAWAVGMIAGGLLFNLFGPRKKIDLPPEQPAPEPRPDVSR